MSTTRAGCPLGCASCGRACNGTRWGRQSHRFDCCGVVAAHVPVKPLRKDDHGWRLVSDPMRRGYLTGPPTTGRAS